MAALSAHTCCKIARIKRKFKHYHYEMLCAWRKAAAMLEAGEINQEQYNNWHYHHPDADIRQKRVKAMSQGLSDMLIDAVKKDSE